MSKEYLEALNRLYECNDDDYTLGYQQHDYKLLQQALQRLEAIDNANPSEALEKLEMLSDCAVAMKEAPSSNWIEYANSEAELDYKLWRAYEDLKQYILKAQEQRATIIELCEYYGLDNLYPYDDLGEIETALKNARDTSGQKRMELLGKLNKQEKVLSIIKEKDVDIYILKNCKTVDEYNSKIVHIVGETRELTQEEFDLLKRWLG